MTKINGYIFKKTNNIKSRKRTKCAKQTIKQRAFDITNKLLIQTGDAQKTCVRGKSSVVNLNVKMWCNVPCFEVAKYENIYGGLPTVAFTVSIDVILYYASKKPEILAIC